MKQQKEQRKFVETLVAGALRQRLSGNPFCGGASKKIGRKSPDSAALSGNGS